MVSLKDAAASTSAEDLQADGVVISIQLQLEVGFVLQSGCGAPSVAPRLLKVLARDSAEASCWVDHINDAAHGKPFVASAAVVPAAAAASVRQVTHASQVAAPRAPSTISSFPDEWAFVSAKDFIYGRPTEPITTKYRLGEQIGHPGTFGVARVGVNVTTGERCAVKLLSKKRVGPQSINLMRSEVEIMQKLNQLKHENHIQFLEYFEDEETLFLVMELATGGELLDQMAERESKKKPYSEQEAAVIALQMFESVRALHAEGLLHADIKPGTSSEMN